MSDRRRLMEADLADLGLPEVAQSRIDGAFIPGEGDEIELVDAYTTEPLMRFHDAGPSVAGQAAAAAQRAQHAWFRATSGHERGRLLLRIAEEIRARAETLARLEALTAGKPIRDCRVEVAKVEEMFAYYAGWADKLHGETIAPPSGHFVYTLREPHGAVLQITPWNAPIFTAGWQIAPALAAGNAVVIKPSELTPLTTLALAVCIEAAGAPPGLVNVLAGRGPTTGRAAIESPAVSKVVFVGSPEGGRAVATSAAAHLKPCVLELGGKSANIVFADADLEAACKGAQAAIFSAAGQSCVAGSRLLVEQSIIDAFLDMLESGMARLKLGDPLDPDTEIGPVASRVQSDRVTNAIARAVGEGAQVRRASTAPDHGFFVAPTILAGATPEASCAQEEIFGPVVAALPFDDEAAAVAIANATPYGLAGSVWTENIARGHRVAEAVRAGTFWVNGYKTLHVSAPFGGAGLSGYGRSSGSDGLMEYVRSKAVWVDMNDRPSVAFGYAPPQPSS